MSTFSYTPWEQAGEKEERGARTFYKSCRHLVWFPQGRFRAAKWAAPFSPFPDTPG